MCTRGGRTRSNLCCVLFVLRIKNSPFKKKRLERFKFEFQLTLLRSAWLSELSQLSSSLFLSSVLPLEEVLRPSVSRKLSSTPTSLITSSSHDSSGMRPHLTARSTRYDTGLCGSLRRKYSETSARRRKASCRDLIAPLDEPNLEGSPFPCPPLSVS